MKRTLVISNACFSDTTSNGRTLKNLFHGTDRDKLAQFFVYGEPDFRVCKKYYKVSDGDALRSLFINKRSGEVLENRAETRASEKRLSGKAGKDVKKTPVKVLGRELVWWIGRWKNNQFWKWIEEFHPEIICLFIANNTFLISLSRQLAERYHIPIIVYTTEGYSFMNYNYFTKHFSLAYNMYYAWLCREYKRTSAYVEKGFFNNTLLRDRYETQYGYPCYCVMNSSQIEYIEHAETGNKLKISYLGNLGLGRYKALIEIAQTLQEIDSELYLDVYGAAPNESIKKELESSAGIKFHGFISYDKVVDVIHGSALLIHTELNDKVMNRDLKYAFSTKIADCICSGTPLLMYASEELAETIFLKENGCAFIACRKEELKGVLKKALTDREARIEVLEKAKITRDRFLTGNEKFLEALM